MNYIDYLMDLHWLSVRVCVCVCVCVYIVQSKQEPEVGI